MNATALRERVDQIIEHSGDDERAHAEEDALHMRVIEDFCPPWVYAQIARLDDADFQRWCA